MRKALLTGGIAVVALLAAAVTYLTLLDVNSFRPQIQAAIEKQLARSVSLGTMTLRIFPLSIRIANVRIAEDPAFKTGRPFASAGEVSVSASLFPLLRRQLRINSFVLRDPAIELVRDRAGRWNVASIGGRGGGGGGGDTNLSIGELRIENGSIAVSGSGRRSVYSHINFGLTDFAPGRPLRLFLSATLSGGNRESLRLEAAGGPFGVQRPSFTGRLEIRKVAFAALRAFLSSAATPADGIIDGTVDFEMKDSFVNARPRLAIDNVRVGGRNLGRGIRIEGELQHDLSSGLVRTSGLRFAAGSIPVVVSGQFDSRKSGIDVAARTKGASIAELLGTAAVLGGLDMSGSGVLTLDARIRGPVDRASELEYFGEGMVRDASFSLPGLKQALQVRSANLRLGGKTAALNDIVCALGSSTLRGGLSIRDFVAPAAAFDLDIDRLDIAELQAMTTSSSAGKAKSTATPSAFSARGTLRVGMIRSADLVLKEVRSECSFAAGLLKLAPLNAQVFNGRQTGAITVDLRSEPAAVAVETKLEAVDANQLLSATTSLKSALFGLLAASGNASMKVLPGNQAARTLNGDLAIRLTKGRLGGVNLMNEIAALGKFVGVGTGAQPFTDVVSLTGDIQVRDGLAKTDNLLIQIEDGSVAAAGTVNLVDQSLGLRITTILGREASQKVGGSRVGGYLTTALVNNRGEIVIPAVVTGTFAKPRFAPDVARVAEMKLKNVLPSSGNTGTVASGVVGLITGEKGAAKSVLQAITGKQAEAGPQQAGAVPNAAPKRKGLLDALESLQKKTQQPAPAQPH